VAEQKQPDSPAASPTGHAGEQERDIPVRLILIGILALYLVLFAVLNSKTVKVSFVLFSTRVSLIVALVLAAVLGFFAGYLGNELRDRRKRKTSHTAARS